MKITKNELKELHELGKAMLLHARNNPGIQDNPKYKTLFNFFKKVESVLND